MYEEVKASIECGESGWRRRAVPGVSGTEKKLMTKGTKINDKGREEGRKEGEERKGKERDGRNSLI